MANKAMINIEGARVGDTQANVEELRESIVWIMDSAFENHMSEKVVLRAIDALSHATASPDNSVMIQGGQFTSRDVVHGDD